MYPLVGVLVGVFIGLRFKVFSLVPVAVCGALAITLHNGPAGISAWSLAWEVGTALIALQFGYGLGLLSAAALFRHEVVGDGRFVPLRD